MTPPELALVARRAERLTLDSPAMDRLLVTGGAGFIGSNFVHHLMEHTDAAGHRARQDDLRREPRGPRRAARGPRAAGRRRHRRARRGRPARRRARRGRPLRRGVAQRQLAARPEPVHPDQHPRHVHDPRGGPQARQAPPPRLDRRGLRRPRARRPQALHRGHALQPVLALLRVQGRLRPPGPRVGPQLRRAGDGLQLLQQLRPLAAHREVHPPPDHQRHRRHPPQALRLGRERPRLDPRRRPLLGRAGRSSSKGRIGETYLIGADGEKNNLEVVRLHPDPDGPARRRLRPRHRPRRPRPALRHRVRQAAPGARLAAAVPGLRVRTGRHHRVVPARTRTGGAPHKEAVEATYAEKGQ